MMRKMIGLHDRDGSRLPSATWLTLLAALTLIAAACTSPEATTETTGDAATETTEDAAPEEDAEADNPEPVTVDFLQPIPRSTFWYPLIVGEAVGFFEEEGIEVNLLPGGDLPETAFIDNGEADIAGSGTAEIMIGFERGIDYRVVYDYQTISPEGLVVAEDSTVQSVDDLAGTTVGLASDSDLATLGTYLETVGLTLDDVETAVVGGSGPLMASSFQDGSIQAFAGAASDFAALRANGIALRDITPEEVALSSRGAFIVATDALEGDAEKIERFLRAWAKSTYVGIVEPEVLAEVGRQVVPEEWVDDEVGQAIAETALALQTPAGDPSEAVFGEIQREAYLDAVDRYVRSDELEGPIDVEELLDDRFIEAVNDWSREGAVEAARAWLADQ